MSNELIRGNTRFRRLEGRNMMAFPRELRRAIPDLHSGRVLELDCVSGGSSNTMLSGSHVELKFVVKETGKLNGEFVIRMDLQTDAARELAAMLIKLADRVEQSESK